MIHYSNPILPGFYPDPSVTRAGEDFYLVCSSFEYFPAVPIFRSRDLIHWEQIGHVLDRVSQLDMTSRRSSAGIYAPTLRYHDGTFYMITTDVGGIGNFYVTATDPAGAWSDPIRVSHGGIDPSLFFDHDGKAYVTVQQGADEESHIIQYEIDIVTGEAKCEPQVVWRGDGGPWIEGPHLYHINGMYYMMSASGGTGKEHREIIGRSYSPYGPFELNPNPILTHNDLDHPIQCLGHADLIEDLDGNWWAVFLGARWLKGNYSVLGRETFLSPVLWQDGWPQIDNNEGTADLNMVVSHKGAEPSQPTLPPGAIGRDHFEGECLGPAWIFIRNPGSDHNSLNTEHKGLTLYGQAGTLSNLEPITFAGRRQQHMKASFITSMSFAPVVEGEEAGLCVRRDEDAHYEIGILHSANRLLLIARLTVRGQSQIVHEAELQSTSILLRIDALGQEYALQYSEGQDSWNHIATGEARALSPEDFIRHMCFTGVVVGLYATGNGRSSKSPASFDWFDYQVK